VTGEKRAIGDHRLSRRGKKPFTYHFSPFTIDQGACLTQRLLDPGFWLLPLFPKRLRLGLKRVFYNLNLNEVRFTGDIVRRARHDGKNVARLRLQNFDGGFRA